MLNSAFDSSVKDIEWQLCLQHLEFREAVEMGGGSAGSSLLLRISAVMRHQVPDRFRKLAVLNSAGDGESFRR
jgi:hypothetical protein